MLDVGAEAPSAGDELLALRRRIDALELEFSRKAFAFAESREWDAEGFNTALDWLRITCHMTSTVAADRLAVGERLGELTQSVQAMDAGEIGFAHVAVMARTANAIRAEFDETRLLDLAREFSPGKFHYKCMHYRHSVDAESYAKGQEKLYLERSLRLSTAEDGCLLISGVLDPAGGAAVRTALEPLARLSGAHDDRKLEQRNADALVELATGKQKVAMQVTASLETLLGLLGAPGAENEFTLPIAAKTVQRWACDCSLTRILMQDSVVIDVGRAERTVKGARRRALMARDRHCRWPGCERLASWCDSHHVVHWVLGGGGELENQVLLCHRHHRMVHEGGWQLIKNEAGEIITIAPTVTFGLPRGPD
jgi:uncharacterized protein DUF222